MDITSVFILFSAAGVGWGIGASSGANVISMLAGPQITSLRKAALIVSALVFCGALLQGGAVIDTIGNGIVSKESLSTNRLAVLSALIVTAVFVILTTLEAVPVSSSHAIVGALIGTSVGLRLTEELDSGLLSRIFASWLLTPIISLLLAFFVYKFVSAPLSKRMSLITYSEAFRWLSIMATAFTAYSLGANNIGNAVGPVLSSGVGVDANIIIAVMALSIVLGILSYSRRMVNMVSRNITVVDPVTTFTAQLSAGLVTFYFTLLGIPISAVQALIGGLVGVGLTKGFGMINSKLFVQMFIGWIVTPVIAALLSIGVYEVLVTLGV
jgi:inorganic phosphate transporter, PiT family